MSKLGDTVTGARVLGSRFAASQRQPNAEGRMPLMEHIRELRNRLIKAAGAILVGMSIGLIPAVFYRIWSFVVHPFCAASIRGLTGCHKLGDQLVINGVFDAFMLRVQVAFFFSLIVTSPIWLYQVWAFIAPGLYRREKRWTFAFVGTAVPLFLGGTAIAYFAMSRGLKYLSASPRPGSSTCRPSPPTSATSRPCCSAWGWPSSCLWRWCSSTSPGSSRTSGSGSGAGS